MLKGRTRETKITRDAQGRWFNDGTPITHVLLTRAFDEWLRPAPDASGRFCLSNDINWAYVTIEGPPRFVRSVELGGAEPIRLRLSDGAEVPLAVETLRQGPDGALYCEVPGGMVARFDSHAMMQLEELVGEDDDGVFLAVRGRAVHPPVVDEPLGSG